MGTQPYWRLGRGSNPLVLADFTDNPNSTARRKWHSRWESNPHLPEVNPGVLSQLNYGVIRWTSGAIERRHSSAGNRTRTAKAFTTDGTPSLLVEDNRSTSAHLKQCRVLSSECRIQNVRFGVTNRIRTGTDAVTGRNAAVTSWPPEAVQSSEFRVQNSEFQIKFCTLHSSLCTQKDGALTWTCTTNFRLRRAACRTNYTLRAESSGELRVRSAESKS